MGCMEEKGEAVVCPSCGLDETQLDSSNSNFLPPGSRLNGRYIVGTPLGQGGFGITYIGYDTTLNSKVAIKEYYPSDIAGRSKTNCTVVAFTQGADDYETGKRRFLNEARTLAKFAEHPCIVGVKDFFDENGTAYMVMEYLNGVSLKEYLNRNGGKISPEEAISILMPVIDALRAVHKVGIIHRDISPDNIFITRDARVRLIDFGSARQTLNGQKSLSVMLKPGYAPEEQYRSQGNQGPWTDIYALTATFYRMITGTVPPDSLERVLEDTLEIPAELPQNLQTAISIGMAVRAAERYTSVDQLQAALIGEGIPDAPTENYTVTNTSQKLSGELVPKQSNKVLIAVAVILGAVFVAILSTIIAVFVLGNHDKEPNQVTSDIYSNSPPIAESAQPLTPPVFTMVTASNVTQATQDDRSYEPSLVLDGNPETAWNVPGGPGEWITISATSPQTVKGMRILNGYTKYSSAYAMWLYYANRRPKDITIEFSDGSSISYTLADMFSQSNYQYQTIDFGEYKKTNFITVRINSVYEGDTWSDCCISEMDFF